MTARTDITPSDKDIYKTKSVVTWDDLHDRQLHQSHVQLLADLEQAKRIYPYTLLLEWPGRLVCIASQNPVKAEQLPPGVVVGAYHHHKSVYVWD